MVIALYVKTDEKLPVDEIVEITGDTNVDNSEPVDEENSDTDEVIEEEIVNNENQ